MASDRQTAPSAQPDARPETTDSHPVTEEELGALQAFLADEVNELGVCCTGKQKTRTVAIMMLLVRAFTTFADNLMYYAGVVLVILAWVLISGVVISWYKVFAPLLLQTASSHVFVAHALFAHWLLINIFFNYFMVTTTPPGQPPKVPRAEMPSYLQKGMKYCKKCDNIKPPRTHHCRVCGRCVLKMDHHCPWTHNCIGLYNQRYFFLFMAYLWVGCIYVAVNMFELFYLRFMMRNASRDSLSIEQRARANAYYHAGYLTILSSFSFMLTVAVGLVLGLLLFYHVWLVSNDLTTIESYAYFSRKDQAEKKRQPKRTLLKKWKRFLGIHHRYTIWGVLLPWKYHPGDASEDNMGLVDPALATSESSEISQRLALWATDNDHHGNSSAVAQAHGAETPNAVLIV